MLVELLDQDRVTAASAGQQAQQRVPNPQAVFRGLDHLVYMGTIHKNHSS